MTRWELRWVHASNRELHLRMFNDGWQPFAANDRDVWYRRPVEDPDAKGRVVHVNGAFVGVEVQR